MIDTVVIYCHPTDSKKEDKLISAIHSELEKSGHTIETYNIIGDVFSPDLLNSEQVDFFDDVFLDNVIQEVQEKIQNCKQIVFVFPKFWDGLTVYTRRFVDKVFLSEWDSGSIFAANKRLKDKKAVIITSMKIPQILFSSRQAGGYSDPFTISILKLCGIKNIKWINVNKWLESNEKLKDKKLEKIRECFNKL